MGGELEQAIMPTMALQMCYTLLISSVAYRATCSSLRTLSILAHQLKFPICCVHPLAQGAQATTHAMTDNLDLKGISGAEGGGGGTWGWDGGEEDFPQCG
jgi:hypothetical protein